MLLNNQWVSEENKEEIKITGDKWKWKPSDSTPVGHSKNSSNRELHGSTSLPQETEKSQIRKSNLHLKEVEKEGKNITKDKLKKNQSKNKWNRLEIKWQAKDLSLPPLMRTPKSQQTPEQILTKKKKDLNLP